MLFRQPYSSPRGDKSMRRMEFQHPIRGKVQPALGFAPAPSPRQVLRIRYRQPAAMKESLDDR